MRKNFFRENSVFLIGWLFITLTFATFLLSYGKAEAFVILNPWHTPVLDILFRIFTYLGDGLFTVAMVVIFFLLRRRRLSLLILSGYAFSGLIVQILKNCFPADRPKLFFEKHLIDYPYFLDNVTLHTINSFPSGHTTSAFALAAALTFMSKKKTGSIFLILMAMMVGYSRIYLGQHFPQDVIAGAAIGVFAAIVSYLVIEKIYLQRKKRIS